MIIPKNVLILWLLPKLQIAVEKLRENKRNWESIGGRESF
jgi:hypothetical protein